MSATENKMEYVRLGRSGLKVSKLILGCMSYGSSTWQDWVLGEKEGIAQIKQAYDLGINAFDTANMYSNGLSEVVLGKAIKQHSLPRDEIVIMTKVFFPVNHEPIEESLKKRYANQRGLSRKHIFESIKHSLERLQLDYVDLFQCHRFDYETPIEETMQALHDVVQAGYVRYIGMSSCYAWQFHKMQNYAKAHGLTQFISMQNLHNATYREEEREMVPLLQDLGVGMIPWSPLAKGFLTRPVSEHTQRSETDGDLKTSIAGVPFLNNINDAVAAIAKKRGVSMAQVVIAWSLSKPFVTAPIIGTTKIYKLKDLCEGVHVKLTEDEIKSIDDLYQPRAIFGHS